MNATWITPVVNALCILTPLVIMGAAILLEEKFGKDWK